MRLKRCAKGHYYDSDLQTACPVCAMNQGTVEFSESQVLRAQKNLEEARRRREIQLGVSIVAPFSDDPREWSQEQVWEFGPFGIDTGVCPNGHLYNEHIYGLHCPECARQDQIRKMSADIRRCANGHIYDAKKHPSCPRCASETPRVQEPSSQWPSELKFDLMYDGTEQLEDEPNIVKCPKGHSYNARVYGMQYCPVCENKQIIRNTGWKRYFADRSPDEVWRPASEVEALDDMPIVWQACLAMANNHQLFVAVHEGLNAIGRGAGNHIVIPSDPTIAFKEHAFLLCDSENKTYYIIGGRTGGATFLNGKQIYKAHAAPLKDGDVLTFGEKSMVFFTQPSPHESMRHDSPME